MVPLASTVPGYLLFDPTNSKYAVAAPAAAKLVTVISNGLAEAATGELVEIVTDPLSEAVKAGQLTDSSETVILTTT